jgi:hypothetical protein
MGVVLRVGHINGWLARQIESSLSHIGNDADDFPGWWRLIVATTKREIVNCDLLADWIFTGEEALCGVCIDDDHERRRLVVMIGQEPSFQQRRADGAEIVRTDLATLGRRCMVWIIGPIGESQRCRIGVHGRHAVGDCGGAGAGNPGGTINHLTPERVSFGTKIVGAQIGSQDLCRLESEIDRLHTDEAAHQQTGTYGQHYSASDFHDDQCRKGTTLCPACFRAATAQAETDKSAVIDTCDTA